MSTAYNKIIAKLETLNEYLGYLRDLQKVNKNSFLNDYHVFGLAEHYLHLSIEAILDAAKLLIISFRLPRPETQHDVFRILFVKKIINKDLYSKLDGITGFRNILIHEYEKVDKKIVYVYLQKKLQLFVNFRRAVLKFLNKSRA